MPVFPAISLAFRLNTEVGNHALDLRMSRQRSRLALHANMGQDGLKPAGEEEDAARSGRQL
jgi:hypothetical protein